MSPDVVSFRRWCHLRFDSGSHLCRRGADSSSAIWENTLRFYTTCRLDTDGGVPSPAAPPCAVRSLFNIWNGNTPSQCFMEPAEQSMQRNVRGSFILLKTASSAIFNLKSSPPVGLCRKTRTRFLSCWNCNKNLRETSSAHTHTHVDTKTCTHTETKTRTSCLQIHTSADYRPHYENRCCFGFNDQEEIFYAVAQHVRPHKESPLDVTSSLIFHLCSWLTWFLLKQ